MKQINNNLSNSEPTNEANLMANKDTLVDSRDNAERRKERSHKFCFSDVWKVF